MTFVKYKGELFRHRWSFQPKKSLILSYDKQKAERFGMKLDKDGFLPYEKNVEMDELQQVEEKDFEPFLYQLKYKDHFFFKGREKENEVEIWMIKEEDLARHYGLDEFVEGQNDTYYAKWIPREEVTPVTEIKEIDGMALCWLDNTVCYIADSSETEYLLKTDLNTWFVKDRRQYYNETWEQREDGWYYQWVPKEKVYVYKDHDETFRY